MAKSRPSVQKRAKELAKREKRQAKAARKADRHTERDEEGEPIVSTEEFNYEDSGLF
ncbi:MAG: hypothetical protein ACI9MC_001234 [Kiritimatiellia bacterium]|jgi:hypothetical protein